MIQHYNTESEAGRNAIQEEFNKKFNIIGATEYYKKDNTRNRAIIIGLICLLLISIIFSIHSLVINRFN